MTQPGHRGAKPGEEHDDAPAQASSVDPAASMSLLTALLANPLDAGYEHYQADHGSRVLSAASPSSQWLLRSGLDRSSLLIRCGARPMT